MKFDHLLTSGYTFSKEESSIKLNYILFNSMILSNMAFLVVAIVLRLFQHNMLLAALDFIYLIVSVAIFVAIRISRTYFSPAFYILIFMSYILVSAIFYKGTGGIGGISWFFILLMTVTFIRGYKEGMVFFIIALITIMLISFNKQYTFVAIATGMMPFIAAYFFMAFFENRNKEFHKIIEAQKNQYAYQAKYDKLTGIPNREFFFSFFEDLLKKISVSDETITILFIDLDDFKKVNDTYGHQAGDKVLRETAKRLKSQLDIGDMLARLGGDEFAAIIKDTNNIEELVNRFHAVMEDPIVIEKEDLELTVVAGLDLLGGREEPRIDLHIKFSMGSATFPDDGRTEVELMGKADRAMYRKKRNTKAGT